MTDCYKSRATASTQGRVSRINATTVHDKYNKKCVCEICTCGYHKCPPNQRRRFEGRTTNQDQYRPYRIPKEEQQQPTYKISQRRYEPEALKTTYNVQYTPKKAPMGTGFGDTITRSVQYIKNKAPFYSDTEYNTKFVPKRTAQEPVEPKYEWKPNRAKFEGQTSYNAEFTPKKPCPQPNLNSNSQIIYQRKNIPFVGETTYNNQYQRYSINPQLQVEQYKYRPNTAKFQGESRYNEQFVPYCQKSYVQEHCPIYDLTPYPKECSPGKRHLNYSAEKKNWQ